MECPHCGEKTGEGKACESCGKDLAPSQGVEVQYKDFKVSELLDIKLRKQVPARQETPKTGGRQVEKKAESSENKRSGIVVTAVLISVATAVFFLLRFLLKF